jgi:hypothetical protein
MISLLNFIKLYQLVQKLLGGTDRQTDRQTGDLTSLTFLFQESRLKTDEVLNFVLKPSKPSGTGSSGYLNSSGLKVLM